MINQAVTSTNEVAAAAVVRHTVKHCPVTHDSTSLPAVFTEMEQAAMDGQLERVKELYNALLADGETGAEIADGISKSGA